MPMQTGFEEDIVHYDHISFFVIIYIIEAIEDSRGFNEFKGSI